MRTVLQLFYSWQARPIVGHEAILGDGSDIATLSRWVTNPATDNEQVGQVFMATPQQVETAMIAATIGQQQWFAILAKEEEKLG